MYTIQYMQELLYTILYLFILYNFQENRKDRLLFGRSYVPELFTACGYIYVQKNTTPSCNVLKDLIKAAGGCITECPETARILIGIGGLKETWILDCITSGELQPHNQYKRS